MAVMELEQAVYQKLANTPAVVALVGTRVFPDDAPPGTALPYVTHEEAEREQIGTLDGYLDLNFYLMHLDCWGETRGQAKAVRRAVKDALLNFTGPASGGTLSVQGVFFEGADVDTEPPVDGSELPIRRAGLDLRFGFSEL